MAFIQLVFRNEAIYYYVAKMSPKLEIQKELTAENQPVSSFQGAPGGTRTRTAVSGQGIFLPLWLSPPDVCGLDYSFTMGYLL